MSIQLLWTKQPVVALQNGKIYPTPKLEIHENGELARSVIGGEVSVRLLDPQGATLSGTLVRSPMQGVVEFPDLTVDKPGVYQLAVECDTSTLIYDDMLGVHPQTPGLIALYQANPDTLNIEDIRQEWPPFLAKPENRYGEITPIGPIGLYDSTYRANGEWMWTPPFNTKIIGENPGFTLLALARSSNDGIYPLRGYVNNEITFELSFISVSGQRQPTIILGPVGQVTTYQPPYRFSVSSDWHLFGFSLKRLDQNTLQGTIYVDGTLVFMENNIILPVDSEPVLDQFSTEIVRGWQIFAQMALFNYALTPEEHLAQAKRAKVI